MSTTVTQVIAPPHVNSVMAIAAHPDDIEFWCAGAIMRLIEAGATARLLLVTSGDKGSSDPSVQPAALAARRETEARAAARVLGIAEVAFLRYPDGEVENTRELRGHLVEWIRRWQPDLLFTHDPEHPAPPYISHRDHRTVGRATLDAVYPLARDLLAFAEHAALGLAPHIVRQVWLFASTQPTSYIDITSTIDRKIAARLEHVSQTGDADMLQRRWRDRAAEIGVTAGVAMAESFAIVRLD